MNEGSLDGGRLRSKWEARAVRSLNGNTKLRTGRPDGDNKRQRIDHIKSVDFGEPSVRWPRSNQSVRYHRESDFVFLEPTVPIRA